MALKPPPAPWDLLQQLGDLVGGSNARAEVDRNLRALAQSALARLDVVSREEFDTQSEVLKRTRDRVHELEAELERMAAELDQLTVKN